RKNGTVSIGNGGWTPCAQINGTLTTMVRWEARLTKVACTLQPRMAAAPNTTALLECTRIRCWRGHTGGIGDERRNNCYGTIGLAPVAALSSKTDSGKWLLS